MRRVLPFAALVLAGAAAAPDKPCTEAKDKLEMYSMGLRAYCAHDNDCASFAIDPDTCATPMVFRKDAHVSDDKEILRLQDSERKACANFFAARPACAAKTVKPVCLEGKCERGK